MSTLALELRSKLSELPLNDAILLVNSVVPYNIFSINLKALSRNNENDHSEFAITDAVYETKQVNLRKSLFYLLDQLKVPELEAVLKKLQILDPTLNSQKIFLYLAASPSDLAGLQTENEYAAIQRVLGSSVNKQSFEFKNPVFATTIDEMVNYINIYKPNIIHFSGHAGRNGIVLSNSNNEAEIIPTSILDNYFGTFNNKIDCVFLNACYSAKQAATISRHVGYVVGMNYPIGDETAILFSESFYRGIFNDNDLDYEKAFKQAKIKIKLRQTKASNIPEIWREGGKIDA
jgi:hypothetical protein